MGSCQRIAVVDGLCRRCYVRDALSLVYPAGCACTRLAVNSREIMRRSLGKWMLALALISLPFGASALEVRADENAEPVVHIFTVEHVSFEYDPGDVVSQQTLRGA